MSKLRVKHSELCWMLVQSETPSWRRCDAVRVGHVHEWFGRYAAVAATDGDDRHRCEIDNLWLELEQGSGDKAEIGRAHKKHKCEHKFGVSVTFQAFLFSFHIFSLVFVAVFSFIFSAHVIHSDSVLHLFFLFQLSVSQFFGCFLLSFCALLLVLFFHIFDLSHSLFSSLGFFFSCFLHSLGLWLKHLWTVKP